MIDPPTESYPIVPIIERSIDIRAPIDDVFAVVTDPKRGPQWNENVLEVQDVSDGPVREGTTWKQIVVMLGRRTTLDCRIVRYQPPHEGLLEISGPYRASIVTQCCAVESGTRVTQTIDFVPPGGIVGQIGARLFRPQLEREVAHALEHQRAALERGTGGRDGSGIA